MCFRRRAITEGIVLPLLILPFWFPFSNELSQKNLEAVHYFNSEVEYFNFVLELTAYLIQWLLYFGLQLGMSCFQSWHQNNITLFPNTLHFRYVPRGFVRRLREFKYPWGEKGDRLDVFIWCKCILDSGHDGPLASDLRAIYFQWKFNQGPDI